VDVRENRRQKTEDRSQKPEARRQEITEKRTESHREGARDARTSITIRIPSLGFAFLALLAPSRFQCFDTSFTLSSVII
jgi:hypothetical protein